MARGFSLVEIVVVLALIGVLAGISAPRVGAYADWLAVRRAEDEAAAFYGRTRISAVYRARRVRVVFGDDSLIAVVEGTTDSVIWAVPGPARHGVALYASRREIRLHPNGIGLGAANTKLVFRRRAAADSLTISRLGRLRRWP